MITRPIVEDGVAVVGFIRDSLDASNSKLFREEMVPVLMMHKRILLDLADLQFVDSSGLGAMLSCLRAVNGDGGQLVLCGMTKPVRTLFELVRMHRIFDVYANRHEALTAMAGATPESDEPHSQTRPSDDNPGPESGT